MTGQYVRYGSREHVVLDSGPRLDTLTWRIWSSAVPGPEDSSRVGAASERVCRLRLAVKCTQVGVSVQDVGRSFLEWIGDSDDSGQFR